MAYIDYHELICVNCDRTFSAHVSRPDYCNTFYLPVRGFKLILDKINELADANSNKKPEEE